MKNHAGAGSAAKDAEIRNELVRAKATVRRVPDRYGETETLIQGVVGPFTLTRRGTYWAAVAVPGMPLPLALKMNAIEHTTHGATANSGEPQILGSVVRAGGYAGGIDPTTQMKFYERKGPRSREIIQFTEKDIGVLESMPEVFSDYLVIRPGVAMPPHVEAVDCYHIDTQAGLNAFAQFVRKNHRSGDWLVPAGVPTKTGLYRARLNESHHGYEDAIIFYDDADDTIVFVRRHNHGRPIYSTEKHTLLRGSSWIEWFGELT
jgi:hypothetical protein